MRSKDNINLKLAKIEHQAAGRTDVGRVSNRCVDLINTIINLLFT
jgi:hypothetical protein